ncbi:MAG: hypothetical protein LBU89_08965 [Fibromonadaceae bacterium]|jgi:CheY-like chemotaxis protein|nr:hypothetical protein [Fibromonadaceae bacterium]
MVKMDSKEVRKFAGDIAKNPFGIIILLLAFVYSIMPFLRELMPYLASISSTKLAIIMSVPLLFTGIFVWLAAFRVPKFQEYIVSSLDLAAASIDAKKDNPEVLEGQDVNSILKNVSEAITKAIPSGMITLQHGNNEVLWVDDNPEDNIKERRILEEKLGVKLSLARSTREALKFLKRKKFVAIISDMGRGEDKEAGYTLLDELRKEDETTPFFLYSWSNKLEHINETKRRKGELINEPQALFTRIIEVLQLQK